MDTKHVSSRPKRRPRGFSLIEAMVVVAVTAVVATTAVPSLVAFIDGRRLDATATALAADVQFVRTEAVARNQPIRISFHAARRAPAGSCTPALRRSAAAARAAPAVCTGGAVEIKTVVLVAADRVSVRANVASIAFDPLHGTSTPTGTLRLVDAGGRAVHHVVNVMGRVRSCTPTRRAGLARLLNFHKETAMQASPSRSRRAGRRCQPRLHPGRDADHRRHRRRPVRASPTLRSKAMCCARGAATRWSR